MERVSLKTKVKQNPEAIFQEIEGRIAILDPEKGKLYNLNETASAIWRGAKKPITLTGLVKKLCQEFEVKPGAAQKDVLEFAASFLKEKFLLRLS